MKTYGKLIFIIITMAFTLIVVPSNTYATETLKNTGNTYQLLNLFGDVFERVRAD